ncbi:DUF6069 family protein [Ornithinimicrobium cryptoxanthini]|uniref:DUF6069 family protein n=1 Tax=Ornithinimicrobium cryptoxanthini TaxID=2934161 RepID=A0ABY4YI19_9MICO|nr:DUF6069 family protein [Ornithinimicrobium cryptoxanthini]USQ76436.1 DUF6069 family protein [Ornithinimicrobium cryptoxanthini]
MFAHPVAPTRSATGAGSSLSAALAWRTGLWSVATALTVNITVLVLARGLGADMLLRRAETEPPMAIGVGMIALMTIAPMLLATLLLLRLRRSGTRAWRVLAVIGLMVAVVTVPAPFTMIAGTDTQVALACMHLAAGAAWFIAVRRATSSKAQ